MDRDGPETQPQASTGDSERAAKTELIARVDAAHPSPSARAQRVLDVLRTNTQLETWDVACFCVEYLGFMTPVWPWLEQDVQRLARLIYTAHYEHFGAELPQEATRKL